MVRGVGRLSYETVKRFRFCVRGTMSRDGSHEDDGVGYEWGEGDFFSTYIRSFRAIYGSKFRRESTK